MEVTGSTLYLRPVGGGREWEATVVTPLSPQEAMTQKLKATRKRTQFGEVRQGGL